MIALARKPDYFWFQQVVPRNQDLSTIRFPAICPRLKEMLTSPDFQANYKPVKIPLSATQAALVFELER